MHHVGHLPRIILFRRLCGELTKTTKISVNITDVSCWSRGLSTCIWFRNSWILLADVETTLCPASWDAFLFKINPQITLLLNCGIRKLFNSGTSLWSRKNDIRKMVSCVFYLLAPFSIYIACQGKVNCPGLYSWPYENRIVRVIRGGADKFLARPGRKQATATKLGIYSTPPHEAQYTS